MRGLVAPVVVIVGLLIVALLGAALIGASAAPQWDWTLIEHEYTACRYVNAIDRDLWLWSCTRCGQWHTPGEGRGEARP